MNLYIYTDESGVFDRVNNDYFVFGGVLYLSKTTRNTATRKYHAVESIIRRHYHGELKANVLSNADKGKVFRSLNNTIKFGVIINQKSVHEKIFDNKKSKQRYLDYAYKIMIKRLLTHLDQMGTISLEAIENINIYCDEHTTATNGRYELRESILAELKDGTFNHNYNLYFPPICSNLKDVKLSFCDSKTTTLIRAADIVANRIYRHAVIDDIRNLNNKVFFIKMP